MFLASKGLSVISGQRRVCVPSLCQPAPKCLFFCRHGTRDQDAKSFALVAHLPRYRSWLFLCRPARPAGVTLARLALAMHQRLATTTKLTNTGWNSCIPGIRFVKYLYTARPLYIIIRGRPAHFSLSIWLDLRICGPLNCLIVC